MPSEYAFELAASNIRFGAGATREVGADIVDMRLKSALVFTDPNLRNLPPVLTALESLESSGIAFRLYDRVRVEPSDESLLEAAAFASSNEYDVAVAVGGGSVIDTAKAANLLACYPADLLEYVNPPIGKGTPVPGLLKPVIAIPTTAGTGSETTGVAIFDYKPLRAKTGIAHRRLKPALGIVDPENTASLPTAVAPSSGIDVLCHALESWTALPYTSRPRPERPLLRPAYQGSNPISDLWSCEALRLTSRYIRRAAADPSDLEARSAMLLAASYAGIGFGNAGVHLPHGMSYPVSGLNRGYRAPGFEAVDHPLVPHGISVIINAPAVFRFTAPANPERHIEAARLLGANVSQAKPEDAGAILSDCLLGIMQDLKLPTRLADLGYTAQDIPALVAGTLPQHRVTKLSPRPALPEDLARLFEETL
jgi:hydroxyacid-oxoacid transhydrogenase